MVYVCYFVVLIAALIGGTEKTTRRVEKTRSRRTTQEKTRKTKRG